MIICLVTDRRRLGAAIGARANEHLAALEAQVLAAARAGVDLVQIREHDLPAAELTALVRSLVAQCRGSSVKILVNDRVDVAIAAGAAGVHLKEASIPPEQVRSIAPGGFVVGCSVHGAASAARRRIADLLIAGTILPTVSKPEADYLGWEGLASVVEAARGTPVLGIGGLDATAIRQLAATGAAGLAAIGAFIPTAARSNLTEFVQKRVIELRNAFDSPWNDP